MYLVSSEWLLTLFDYPRYLVSLLLYGNHFLTSNFPQQVFDFSFTDLIRYINSFHAGKFCVLFCYLLVFF